MSRAPLLVLGALLPALAAAAPKPKPAPAPVVAAAPEPEPARPFAWDVPGLVSQVEVSGVQEARGIPLQLHSVTSSWTPDALWRHFAETFRARGFYIPPPEGQTVVHGALSLTAVDVDRDLVYTVLLRPSPQSKNTQVLLSTANVGQARKPDPSRAFAPVYPDAQELVTSDVETGRAFTYVTRASAEQLATFYRDAMKAAGWRETRPGFYRKDAARLQVLARPLEDGRLSVVVMEGRLVVEDGDAPE